MRAPAPPSSPPVPPPLNDDPELYQIVSLFFMGAAVVGLALAWVCIWTCAEGSPDPDCALPPEEGEAAHHEPHDHEALDHEALG